MALSPASPKPFPFRIPRKRLSGLRLAVQAGFFLAFFFSLLYLGPTALLVVMGVSCLGGAWYCGWACPFGFAQDLLSRLGKRLFGRRLRMPARIERFAAWLRYPLFGLSLAGFAYLDFLSEPLRHFTGLMAGHTAYVSAASWLLLAAFLALSVLADRPFCRYFCFEGAKYGLLSLARPFAVKREADRCVSCGACDRACPAQLAVSTQVAVRHPACNNCLECVRACPVDGCLTYGLCPLPKAARKEGIA